MVQSENLARSHGPLRRRKHRVYQLLILIHDLSRSRLAPL